MLSERMGFGKATCPVLIMVDILYNALLNCITDIVKIRAGHEIEPPREVCRRFRYCTEHDAAFRQHRANLFLQNVYELTLVMEYKFSRSSTVLSKAPLLKSNFNHGFRFCALPSVLECLCIIDGRLGELNVKVV